MPSSPKIYLSCGKKKLVRGNTLITKAHLSNLNSIARPAPPCKKPGGQETHQVSKNCKKPCKFHEKITKILVQYFHHLFVHQIEVSGNPSSRWVVMINFDFILVSWLPWFILVSFWFHDCHDSFWFHVSLGERQYSHHPPLFCWFCFQQAKGQNCWGSRRWVPESLVQQDHLTG